MQKFTLLICSLCAIVAMGIGFSSCKDEEPFVKPNLSVKTATITVAESVGTVQVEFVLDKGAPGDITVEYDLSGTATSPADYTIVGKEGEVKIANGQTSGVVEIQIVSDAIYEGDETIKISIEDVSSPDVIITNNDETEIKITDDDPQVILSMKAATVTVNEDDEELMLEINLSAQSPQPITVGYTLSGTALDLITGINEEIHPQYWDYVVDVENEGELVIPANTTTFQIPLVIFTDFMLEDDETIVLTLSDVSNGAQISSTANKTTVTVEQQDGKALALVWSQAHTDVDMDLFLWDVGNDPDSVIAFSANAGVTPRVEALFIPAILEAGSLGASYVYYSGTANPMNFEAHFADVVDGVIEPVANQDVFSGSYTLANINEWDKDGAPMPAIVQTFSLSPTGVTNISTPITIPSSGSRMATVATPKGIRKMKMATRPNILKQFK